ncbi:Uncharacterised protein [Vibrio cholerae]|nr:Uncharacterised protein [Vibrio cholerae]
MASIRVLRDGSSGIGGSVSRIKSPRFIRYCLGCITAQHEQYGEHFWRREWQVSRGE